MLEQGSGAHCTLFFSASRCFNRHVAKMPKTVPFAASISFYKHLGCFCFDFVGSGVGAVGHPTRDRTGTFSGFGFTGSGFRALATTYYIYAV